MSILLQACGQTCLRTCGFYHSSRCGLAGKWSCPLVVMWANLLAGLSTCGLVDMWACGFVGKATCGLFKRILLVSFKKFLQRFLYNIIMIYIVLKSVCLYFLHHTWEKPRCVPIWFFK